jgi:hypothetical protein
MGWRCDSSIRVPASKHKALNSNPSTAKKKKKKKWERERKRKEKK